MKKVRKCCSERGATLNTVIREGLPEMFELRPEHLSMSVSEVSRDSKKTLPLHAQQHHGSLGGGGQRERKGSSGQHRVGQNLSPYPHWQAV